MHLPNAVGLTVSLALYKQFISPDNADTTSHEQGFCLMFSLASSSLMD